MSSSSFSDDRLQQRLADAWQQLDRETSNAVIGNVEDVALQLSERFHPEDRLMLWFDFFNHDSARVTRNMEAFVQKVAPRAAELQR